MCLCRNWKPLEYSKYIENKIVCVIINTFINKIKFMLNKFTINMNLTKK